MNKLHNIFYALFFAGVIAALALLPVGQAHAATVYTLPGSLPAGCTATSSILYTCSNLSLNWADSIKVTNANTRLTITGALDFGGGNDINFSSPASGFVIQANTVSGTNFVRVKGDIIATSTLTLSSNTNSITGNISAGGITSLGGSITGAVTTTGGAVSLASGTSVTGNVTSTGGAVTINPSGVTVGGDVTASAAVSLASGTKVTGNVISTGGDVTLASSNVGVGMCIKAPSSKAINLGWNASAGGVCCSNGSVCSNTCVANNSGNAMPGLCTVTTLIAQYRMEEVAWTGTTGELKDSAGYTGGPFNGQAIGSPFATPASANPAKASNPGTCGYATMSGGAFDIPNLPVVTTPGAKTSVAFWMYWDGTNGVMPMGWKLHDLWLVGGFFGFNTSNNDVYGISSSALKNGWHHVVAIFTNGSVTDNKLYIDGVDQSLSQRQSSPLNNLAVVSSTLRIGGWTANNNYRFKSAIDELAVFNGALSASEVTALFAQTHACPSSQTCLTDNFATGTLDTSLWNVYGVGYTPQVVTTPTVPTPRLRLTDNSGGRATFAQLKKWFPGANNEVVVEFDFFGWGGSGADGIAMVLSDASASPAPGGFGGSLGYANRSGSDGFGGGWLGIGLDEFGNFPGTGEGRRGYPTGYTPPTGANTAATFAANSIAVRGSGTGQSAGYALLANSGALSPAIKTGTSATDSTTKHRYRITVDHSNSINAYVSVERDTTGTGSSYTTVIPAFDIKVAAAGQATVPANFLLSFTGSTGGSTNNHEISNVRVCATSMNAVGGSAPAANFECMDDYLSQASYVNRQTTASGRNPIYTKLARTAFKLRMVPLASDGAIKPDYIAAGGSSKSVTVELFDNNSTPAPACSAYSASNLVATQSATLASGVAYLTNNFTVNKAYSKVMCRVTDSNGASPVYGCSSDSFAVRPGAVTLSTTPTMAAPPSASSASPIKAGSNFTLRATTSTNSSDAYAGTLGQTTGALTAQTTAQDTSQVSGGVIGTLTPASLVSNAVAVNATYSEVGYLYLAAGAYQDSSFTAVDGASDCVSGSTSVTLSGGKYGCVIGTTAQVSLGRFIPDHFDVAVAASGAIQAACTSGNFTYTGQPMVYASPPSLTIKPMNAASAGSVTQNYQGVFQKLGAANVLLTSPSFDGSQLGADGSTLAGLVSVLGTGGLVNSSGTMTYTLKSDDAFTYTRNPNALVAPYSSAIWLPVASVIDSDTVSAPGSLPTLKPTGVNLRFGRLRLENAFGSEKLSLAVPLQAQHWAGSYFVINGLDSCTALSVPAAQTLGTGASPAGAAGLYFYPVVTGKNQLLSSDTVPTLTSPLVAGKSKLSFTAPQKTGWLDVILQVPPYLLGNWGNCSGQTGAAGLFDDLPCARAAFGIYGSKSPIIYRRENY